MGSTEKEARLRLVAAEAAGAARCRQCLQRTGLLQLPRTERGQQLFGCLPAWFDNNEQLQLLSLHPCAKASRAFPSTHKPSKQMQPPGSPALCFVSLFVPITNASCFPRVCPLGYDKLLHVDVAMGGEVKVSWAKIQLPPLAPHPQTTGMFSFCLRATAPKSCWLEPALAFGCRWQECKDPTCEQLGQTSEFWPPWSPASHHTLQWVAGHQSEPQAAPACGESPALCLQRGEDGNETAVPRLFSQGTSLPWMRVFIFP